MLFVMRVSKFFVICVYISHICTCSKNKRKKDGQSMHDKTPPKCNLKLRALNRSCVVTATVKICFIFCCFSDIDWFVKCFGKWAVDEPRCHWGDVLQLEDKKPFLNRCMAALALASEYCVTPVSVWRRQSKWFSTEWRATQNPTNKQTTIKNAVITVFAFHLTIPCPLIFSANLEKRFTEFVLKKQSRVTLLCEFRTPQKELFLFLFFFFLPFCLAVKLSLAELLSVTESY